MTDDRADGPGPTLELPANRRLVEALLRVGPLLGDLLGLDVTLDLAPADAPRRPGARSTRLLDRDGTPLATVHARVGEGRAADEAAGLLSRVEEAQLELAQLEALDRRLLLARTALGETLDGLLSVLAARLPGARAAAVMASPGAPHLQVAAERGLPPTAFGAPLDGRDGPIAEALASGVPRAWPADRFALDPAAVPGASEVLVAPLVPPAAPDPRTAAESLAGALLVVPPHGRSFSVRDLSFVRRLGVHGAVLLENARLLDGLRASEATYRTMVERAGLGMALIDRNLRLRHINGPLRSLLGEDVRPGDPLLAHVMPTSRDRLERYLEDPPDDADGLEVSMLGPDGPVPVRLLARPLHDPAQRPTGHVVIVSDRSRELALETERRAMERRVQQAEKLSAIGKFVAGIAHELNNPLTVVIGYAELLTAADLPPHHHASAHQVLIHARRCGRIVEDLLKFARHQRTQPEAVHLRAVIEEALEATASRGGGDVSIERDLPRDLPPIEGSPHALTQVVSNVLDNAHDAVRLGDGPRRIRVALRRGDGVQRIEITDSGPGIPEPERIFDPFYTTKPIGKGTGLGLSICYGIVNEHGGELAAENLPGGGARLTITLPEGRPEEVALPALPGVGSEEEASPRRLARRARLLVVDDEPAILTLAAQALAPLCAVTTAETVEAAVRLLEESTFDVILTDLRLPAGLTGADFYEILQDRWPEMIERLAFMTGDTIGQASQAFLDRVRRPCLIKPFKLSQLVGFIEALVPG